MIRFFSRLGTALMVLVGAFSFGQSNIPATPSEAVMLLGGNAFQNLTETHTGMIHYPDVGTSQIIFVYAGQLWRVPKDGGTAVRITDADGPISYPRLSPDEKSVAFTGTYNGIYTIPVLGGNANRITHQPGTTTLCDWTPDGRVLFMTDAFMHIFDNDDQARVRELFTVSARGGFPQKVPVPYGANGSISPDGQWLAYTFYANVNGLTEAKKHYFGGYAPDIWLFNLRSHESKRITDWKGTDTLPMWHGETVYYVSDQGAEGRLNIWSYNIKSGRRQQITYFKEFDVKWPSMGPGSSGQGKIVLVDGLDLYLLDIDTRQLRKVQVTIPADLQPKRWITVDASKSMANWSLSPEGNKSLIEARGDIWVVDNVTGVATNLTHTSGAAERDPAWSPNGAWISYFSDASGEYELYVARADGTDTRQVTHLGTGFRFRPVWSPDGQSVAFHDSTGSIYLHVVSSGETKKIDRDPNNSHPWSSQLSWSPDSQWLAYPRGAKNRTHYAAIWLYSVVEDRSHQVTSGSVEDSWPIFDRNGEYLYFVSARNFRTITFDTVEDNNFIYPSTEVLLVAPLRTGLGPPWMATNNAKKERPKDESIKIDLTDFERRVVFALRDKGRYSNLAITNDGRLLFSFTPIDGEASVKEVDLSKSREPKEIVHGVGDFRISSDGSKLLVRNDSGLFVVDAVPQQKLEKPVRLDRMMVEIDLRSEGQQIFNDAWRLYRDIFFDEKMRGVDWPAMRAKYAKLATLCTRREDIYEVIREMLGELGTSHLHVIPSAADQPTPENTGMLAVDFELTEGAYRISKIYDGTPSDTGGRNPLASPGVNVYEGTFVLAVNGVKIDPSQDPWVSFKGLAGTDTTLTVSDKPFIDQTARSVTVNLLDRWGENIIRQRAWVEANRSYVDRKSGGKVGYLYLADTYFYGSREFTRQFNDQLGRKALIVDGRWNEGGLHPFHVIEVLGTRSYPISSYLNRRAAGSETLPGFINEGPKCLLINGVTLSGGDGLAYYFTSRGLGKLIGTTTMGANVGLGPLKIPYVDAGFSSIPIEGIYDEAGGWAIEGRGVPPDITVIDDPALMWRGGDPQLDRAIQQLLSEIRQHRSFIRQPAVKTKRARN